VQGLDGGTLLLLLLLVAAATATTVRLAFVAVIGLERRRWGKAAKVNADEIKVVEIPRSWRYCVARAGLPCPPSDGYGKITVVAIAILGSVVKGSQPRLIEKSSSGVASFIKSATVVNLFLSPCRYRYRRCRPYGED
jgi:hypothetical protein